MDNSIPTPTTEIRIQGNAVLLPLRAKPSLSTSALTLATDDGAWTIKCPKAIFPFAATGEVVFMTISGVMATLDPGAPKSSLIIPQLGVVQ